VILSAVVAAFVIGWAFGFATCMIVLIVRHLRKEVS